MQRARRSTVTTEIPVHTNGGVTATASTPMKRKVRRRRKTSPGCSEEFQSLVLIAVVTAFLTAAFVWIAAKAYTYLFFAKTEAYTKKFGHRNHHVHDKVTGKAHKFDPNAKHKSEQADDDWDILPHNSIYHIPEAMDTLGDRSDEYATLRKKIDEILPPDAARSRARLHELTKGFGEISTFDMIASNVHSDALENEEYDIYNCPDTPPKGYPFEWKLVDDVLTHWPVLEVDNIPSKIHQGLCVFDYEKDYEKALAYREAEKPYVVVNDPDVARTVERWSIPGYLSEMLGKNTKHRAEYNTNSHFLYKNPGPNPKRRRKPQVDPKDLTDYVGRTAALQRPDVIPELIRMTYDEWLEKANKTHVGAEEEHWYFRLIGCGYMGPEGDCDMGSSEYLYDELPYFQPRNDNRNAIYMGEPREQKGIHCRFGMKGVIAENHFDATRNAIVVLGGRRRYILSHPKNCPNLSLLPKGHESARHSEVDYADPDLERFPEFGEALGNEVILEAGQVLYLPTYWFHYIVSLELNFQCNARSGVSHDLTPLIHDCGF